MGGSRELGPWIPMSSSLYCCPRKAGGLELLLPGANYIPPIPRAPTHALLGEKRKKKMRKGSWGTETDPKMTALLRSTRMTKAQTSASSFDSEHRAGTEQGAVGPGDQKGEGLKRCRPGAEGLQGSVCCLPSMFQYTSRVLAPKVLPRERFACLAINIRMSNLTYTHHLPCFKECVLSASQMIIYLFLDTSFMQSVLLLTLLTPGGI